MSTCGGTISTSVVQLGPKAQQLAGQLEQRTRLTIRAHQNNDAPVYLVASPTIPYHQGFPLFAGEAYTFDDRGARAACYAIGPHGGDKTVYVITEGA